MTSGVDLVVDQGGLVGGRVDPAARRETTGLTRDFWCRRGRGAAGRLARGVGEVVQGADDVLLADDLDSLMAHWLRRSA
jgi:hypothetical protein